MRPPARLGCYGRKSTSIAPSRGAKAAYEHREFAMGDLSVWQELALVGAFILIFISICLLEGSSE